jgi:four helix bundle protein
MHNFKELKVWQEAMTLAKEIYATTKSFPGEEKYGLTSQINRCSISIPSNIAEGAGRSTDKDFNHFLNIALGSAFELETQLLLSNAFNFITKEQTELLTERVCKVQRMINGLKKSVMQPS